MKKIFLAAAIVSITSTFAFAQQTTQPSQSQTQGPAASASSFTEMRAQDRLATLGYTNISALTVDAGNVWRGTATKNGKVVKVGVDSLGNIIE
ncbi:MAG: PepSY domain-containing protein [Elstera sp.]